MLAITLAALAIVLAAWVVSFWKSGGFSYGWTNVHPVGGKPHASNRWVKLARMVFVANKYGSFSLGYLTLTSNEGSKEEVAKIEVRTGWRVWTGRPERRWPDWLELTKPPEFEYAGLADFKVSILGHEVYSSVSPDSSRRDSTVPHWSLSLLLGGVAFWLWFPQRRAAQRRAKGQCPRCGYDRRGVRAEAACPECGNAPEPPAARSPPIAATAPADDSAPNTPSSL